MKYCVNGRQPYSILKKADQVKVHWEDRAKILDFIENIPEVEVILEIPNEVILTEYDWNTLTMYNDKLNFCLAINNPRMAQTFTNSGFDFYWPYPITSYYELRGILALKPKYILLGPPLSFDLEAIHNITTTKIRLIANASYDPYIPRENGVRGQWVRPEDVASYEQYVDTLEFVDVSLAKEATLLHIYKENGQWPGNLNLLFDNFNVNVDNRAIPEDLGERRMNCRQRCMRDGTCHRCDSAIHFADLITKKHEEQTLNS